MSLWPFKPVDEVIEVLEWSTDVIRAKSGEQRLRLRDRPRRQWNFSHIFDAESQSAARAIIRGSDSFQVPDWIAPIYYGAVSAGSSVSMTMTTAGLGLVAGASVVVWVSETQNEVCTIESVSPTALVLSFVANARASSQVYRVDDASANVELSITRIVGPWQRASISFYSPSVEAYAATSYPQYRGHDLLEIAPVVTGGGTLSESLSYPVEVFDNMTGKVGTSFQRIFPDDKFMMRWHVFTASEISSLRAWIATRCGKWKAFWQSTRLNDLVAAASITSSGTSLRVYAPTGSTTLGRTAFDIEINAASGLYRRQVTNVSSGPAVNGRPTFDLTISSSLGAAVAANEFHRISYLRCVRFDADRIELLHRPGEGLAVSVPCIEVPVP